MSRQADPASSKEGEAKLFAELAAKDKQAHLLDRQGRHAEAESVLRSTLDIRQTVLKLPADHRDILNNKNNLAAQLKNQRQFAEAEALHREVLEAETRIYGLEHPDTISDLNNLAEVFSHSGRFDEAIAMQKQALSLGEKLWGRTDLNYLLIEENFGNTLANKGDLVEAEHVLRKVMKEYQVAENVVETAGPKKDEDDQGIPEGNYLRAMNNLASILGRMGRSNEAVAMYRSVIEEEKDPLGKAISLGNLAGELKRLKRFHEAEVAMSESLKIMVQCVGQEDWRVNAGLEDLKYVLHKQGKNEEAKSISIGNIAAVQGPKL